MKGQRRIRGVSGDSVWLTIAPDPLDEKQVPVLHVALTDGPGTSCVTDGDGTNASVVGLFTIAGARRMHAALGVARQTINAWRRGDQRPTNEHARKLAALTNNAVPAKAWRAPKTEAS